MKKINSELPQLKDTFFLTDGGLETTLIFQQGIELPHFAAFVLLQDEAGKQVLKDYYLHYLRIAKEYKTGFILETVTWRANQDWGNKLGYSADGLEQINKTAVAQLENLRDEFAGDLPIVISGNIGPRGDGYVPGNQMTAPEAHAYHTPQIKTFSQTTADLVTAMTINYSAEAIGIIKAAQEYNMPVVISYTLETDGNLPSGELLKNAIVEVDKATANYAAYYMINCAHPQHFIKVLQAGGDWLTRIKGIRANASTKSHAELDESETLDTGNKQELATGYLQLKNLLPNLNIIGGCCGTDHTHLQKICESLFTAQSV